MADGRVFEAGYYYHIYNRGKEKQKLFFNNAEYQKAIKIMLYHKRRFKGFKLVSYCFLPNHFHLVVFISKSNSELPKFMEIRTGQYARYFTQTHKHKTKTRVFAGNFKAKKIDTYSHLNQCFLYVEQNAIKHKLVDKSGDREFCSEPYFSNTVIDRNKITSYKNLDLDFFEAWEF